MEKIREAVERARASYSSSKSQILENLGLPARHIERSAASLSMSGPQIDETELNLAHLLSKRVISHDAADQRSRPYDMLRTQVLQAMSPNGWKILAVTSPTSGCGKTLTAVNLAFSISRQQGQSVALLDIDLQKPQIANCLGITPAEGGVLGLLNEQTTLQSAMIPVRAGSQRMFVLPTVPTRESSELMGSRAMRSLLQDLRRDYQTVIVDLPPILPSDDVISVLPEIDCVILVAAVGHSKVSEVEECLRHLQSSAVVRLVLNKATDSNSNYYTAYTAAG